MPIFITPSNPNRIIEYWGENNKNLKERFLDYFSEETENTKITVNEYLLNFDYIFWDWKRVRKDRIKIGDEILIYFSSPIKKVEFLTQIQDFDYYPILDRPLIAVLKVIKRFNDNQINQLKYSKLKEAGIQQFQNLYQIRNQNSLEYLSNVIKE